jgi:DNA-directed RNA polymerase I and III subunit RPAC2
MTALTVLTDDKVVPQEEDGSESNNSDNLKREMTHPTHPRDAFVSYQDELTRRIEGDEVDSSLTQKVRLDLQHLDESSSVATVTFTHEDHTLGNPLRHVLMQMPHVTSAGYAIPHPLEPKMVLHLQSTTYAVDALAEGLERLGVVCDQTRASFDAAFDACRR